MTSSAVTVVRSVSSKRGAKHESSSNTDVHLTSSIPTTRPSSRRRRVGVRTKARARFPRRVLPRPLRAVQASPRRPRTPTVTCSAPSLRALTAASIATLPPPTTSTRGPGARFAVGDSGEESRASGQFLFSIKPDARQRPSPGREEHGVVVRAQRLERHVAAEVHAAAGLLPEHGESLDHSLHGLGREPISGDTIAKHAARSCGALYDGDRVTAQTQIVCGGRPAGPEPTTATKLPLGAAGVPSSAGSVRTLSPRNRSTSRTDTA